MALTYALFGMTPPDTNSAKEGTKEGGPTKPLHTLLKPLSPMLDKTEFDNASHWREHSITSALRLLCAAVVQEEDFIQAVTSAKEPLKIVPVLRFQQIRFGSSNFRVNNVALSKLTHLLFSFEQSQNIRKSIIDCVGYTSCSTETQDADCGSVALSLVFYMHQCTPAHTTLNALCGNVSPSQLSRAVAKRLLSCAKRPDSVASMQVANLIFEWILSELRMGRASELSAVLLGLPSRKMGGNWKPRSKQYAGVLLDCFDAILELLNDINYATAKPTSSISSYCLEIIFRLYDLLQGGSEDRSCLKVVLYTAERLRSVDFWNTNLLIWLSDRGILPLHRACSYDSLQGTDPNILNCIAWLLKGLTIEIKLLVGFANASVLESGLGSLLAPRPMQCEAILSTLFGSEEAIIQKLTESIPLKRESIDPSLIHPPVEALRLGAYGLPGPSDVVSDYQLVDFELVSRAMESARATSEEVESIRQWVEEWNALAAWDCAASHVSNATYVLMSAGLYSSESLRAHESIGQIVGLQAHGQTRLLAMILHRLMYTETSHSEQHRGMDATLFPAATRNLSNAALVLSERITAFDKQEAPSASELLAVAALMSQTLAFSSVGDEAAVEVPTRNERTAVLASALSSLLRFTSHAEPSFVRQYKNEFLSAANSLAKLCLFEVDSSKGIVSLLARSTFGSLLDACSDDEEEQMSESFIFTTLPKVFLGSLMDLVVSMDENICSFLQTIALQPFGAEILIDSGICNALQAASKVYLAEEARVSTQLQSASFNKVSLATPCFLMSHLKLLSTLMSSTSLPVLKSIELSIHASDTLALYREIIKRLCYNFPSEADVLRWFMRCFVQASSLAQPIDVSERHDLLAEHSSKLKQRFAEMSLIENGVLMLCQQLWENPLPRDLLLQVPSELLSHTQTSGLDLTVVSIEKESLRSWWDVLNQILLSKGKGHCIFDAPIGQSDFWGTKSNRKWDENKFEYGIVAMDILSLGISLLKRLNRFELIDISSIARGLYHCSFAAQVSLLDCYELYFYLFSVLSLTLVLVALIKRLLAHVMMN
jgi:hypothetical protein